jgi:hypothetical protein
VPLRQGRLKRVRCEEMSRSLKILAVLAATLALSISIASPARTPAEGKSTAALHAAASHLPVRGAITVELKARVKPDYEVTVYGYVDRVEVRIERRSETSRAHQVVTYSVPGTIGEGGFKARWGGLGDVAMTFTPHTPSGHIPDHDCHSNSLRIHGAYDGHLRFEGEEGYVHVDISHAPGEMRFDRGFCPGQRAAARAAAASPGSSRLPRRPPRPGREEAVSLDAFDRGSGVNFQAYSSREVQDARRSNRFIAQEDESVGEITIHRETDLYGAAPPTFVYDLRRGLAHVRPPAPFTGSASFSRPTPGRPQWSGSLQVPLLGGGTIPLTGSAFHVGLEDDRR